MTASRRRQSGDAGPPRKDGHTAAAGSAAAAATSAATHGAAGGADEERIVKGNRSRARTIAALVGLVPGVVVGVVLVVIGQPVVAVAALVVVAGGVAWWTAQSAPARVRRAVGARPSDESSHPRLHNLVDGLCASMGLPRPAICVVEHEVPNAMAVGRGPSAGCLIVTTGLERSLTLVQLEGVLAHELVHIKRGDTVLAGVATVALVPWSVVVGLPRAADGVHALVGPGREFAADQRAAEVVRYPPGIGSALEVMAGTTRAGTAGSWPPGRSRTAALTRWLWIDPTAGNAGAPTEGNLDDTRVRAEAQSLR